MPGPVDPHNDLKYILEGRIVTMNDDLDVLEKGRICVEAGTIKALLEIGDPFPEGFSSEDIIKIGGTVYPGMIELHNHLPYNILPYWISTRAYGNHEQWKRNKEYRQYITGPMQTLGKTADFPGAIVRYTECKSLLAGVTTSQGWTLANSQINKRYYHGLIRNVEETNENGLPEAEPRIADVTDPVKFKDSIKPDKTKILHLSEGVDEKARSFFTNLQINDNEWAITDRLAGIHCTGLAPEDFEVLANNGGSMIWSPLSNLILYGATANIKAAKANGVRIALGADWSPSGGKNLLEELKVAKLVSDHESEDDHGIFTDEELVQMVTSNPAKMLGWDALLGSIETGKKADFLVLRNFQDDPYEKLIAADEKDVTLVIIGGMPRSGETSLMEKFSFPTSNFETIQIENVSRDLYLDHPQADPVLQGISLRDATERLKSGLANIKQLAENLEMANVGEVLVGMDGQAEPQGWMLIPDLHEDASSLEREGLTESHVTEWGAGIPFSELAIPLALDKLTVIEDDFHFEQLSRQPNIPDYIRSRLPGFYGRTPLEFEAVPYAPHIDNNSDSIPVLLETFLQTSSNLQEHEKWVILEQATLLLEKVYVHLPLKTSMYAVNPLDRLRVLQNNLRNPENHTLDDDNVFHRELLEVFGSLRDLHTNYILPLPYKYRFAYLPFIVEECFEFQEDEKPKFLVTKTLNNVKQVFPDFEEGVELISWNNTPIERVVELNARQQSGSNDAARRARGIDTLTLRPLSINAPPDSTKVQLAFRKRGEMELKEVKFDWVVSSFPPRFDEDNTQNTAAMIASGLDYQTNAVNHVKELFYGEVKTTSTQTSGWKRGDNFPGLMKAKSRSNNGNQFYGYIRIFSFAASNAELFIDDFKQLFSEITQEKEIKGLILDIRGNGGGLISASEKLLELLVGKNFEPQGTQFLNSDITLQLCQRHNAQSQYTDLSPWEPSINLSKQTGETYSLSFPITNIDKAKRKQKIYNGPILLITDALCYSASDIFATGFKDHQAGKILGIHKNTGAGGANVWSHSLLKMLLNDPSFNEEDPRNPFKSLPKGASMRVAVRRTLRQGVASRGLPVEDLGVIPDYYHKITRNDLLKGNIDLLNKAIDLLEKP